MEGYQKKRFAKVGIAQVVEQKGDRLYRIGDREWKIVGAPLPPMFL